ncbi:MAG: hypothetical protein PUB22_00595 [Clostridiales bacterium]|nr:hypothetical protein [Clostridiales bacterium]
MKTYELVREIFNQCANNQMRDVFFEEIETENTDDYVSDFLKEKEAEVEKSVGSDGTIYYDVNVAGVRQRFTFTEV